MYTSWIHSDAASFSSTLLVTKVSDGNSLTVRSFCAFGVVKPVEIPEVQTMTVAKRIHERVANKLQCVGSNAKA